VLDENLGNEVALKQRLLSKRGATADSSVSLLSRFQRHMRQALQGRGAALIVEGRAGLGRSRALDACVLDAKTLGVSILRATATDKAKPFGLAQLLSEQ
jgi:hypothetical protein